MSRVVLRFIRNRGLATQAICWVTNSLWSHVEFGVEDEAGNLTGWIGAHAGDGVQIRSLDYCSPLEERRYAIPVSDHQHSVWKAAALARVGTQYNYANILGLLFRVRGLNSPHRLICSQFCFETLAEAGIWLLNVQSGYEHLITPETLHLSPLLIARCIGHTKEP